MTVRRTVIAGFLAVSALSTASLGQAQAPAPVSAAPVVKIAQGSLKGVDEAGVRVFRGIPYAAAPVGNLRWRPPVVAPSWKGERDAAKAGAGCADNEDCLFLNVHTPTEAHAGAKLPVMVWIHGGSFTSGSGASYNGNTFAKRGVVAVTINYRLGRMGYFAHPALTAESKDGRLSNYGAMDQIAALKWIKANIAAFGGDPAQVTIAGESAGAVSVNYLMIAPDARGLFSKAISESGFARYDSQSLAFFEKAGVDLAAKAGVTGTGADALAKLRAQPMSALPPSGGSSDLSRPHPVIDGKVLPMTIPAAFAAGKQAKVPFLIGGNSNEASFFRIQNSAERLAAAPNKPGFTAAYDPDRKNEVERLAHAMVTAQEITEPDRNAAREHVKAGVPTYLYYFSYVTPAQRATSLGAAHAAEIRYASNTLAADASPQDQATAQSMNAYWASFVKYGNPGAAGGPAWPRYDLTTEPSLEFGNAGPLVREKLLSARLDWAQQALGGRITKAR